MGLLSGLGCLNGLLMDNVLAERCDGWALG